MSLLGNILSHRPWARRGRSWRFVSPRRHGLGLVVLAVLLTLYAGHVYLRIHAGPMAEAFLHEFSRGDVSIGSAEFALFGPIVLNDVRIRVPGDEQHPETDFLAASSIRLYHNPWSLLGGMLSPEQIVCVRPTVYLRYPDEGKSNAQRLYDRVVEWRSRQPVTDGKPGELPQIVLLDSELRIFYGDQTGRDFDANYVVGISLKPPADPNAPGGRSLSEYRVIFEEKPREGSEGGISGKLVIDVYDGGVTVQEWQGGALARLREALPAEFREVLRRWDVRGVLGKTRGGTIDLSRRRFELSVQGGSMRLFPDSDALRVADVDCEFRVSQMPPEVVVRRLTGRLAGPPDANVVVRGRYAGLDANAPFDLRLDVTGLRLPGAVEALERLGVDEPFVSNVCNALEPVMELFSPEGTADVHARVVRDANGLRSGGEVHLRGMSLTYREFPYPLRDVEGVVRFGERGVTDLELSARRGEARLGIVGEARRPEGATELELTIDARRVPVDETLREALSEELAWLWPTFQPAGRLGARAHVVRRVYADGRVERSEEVRLLAGGELSGRFVDFPYRLDRLEGESRIAGGVATVERLVGRHGPGVVALRGRVRPMSDGNAEAVVFVGARDVPIDEDLLAAFDPRTRAILASFHAAGRVERASIEVRTEPGKDPNIHGRVHLADVRGRYEHFPYPFADANGVLALRPGVVEIERFSARRGDANVSLRGEVHYLGPRPRAALTGDANALAVDDTLREALPEALRESMAMIRPKGVADVAFRWEQALADPDDGNPGSEPSYRFVIRPRSMRISPRWFPYPLENVEGRAVADANGVRIETLTASRGPMTMRASGTVLPTEDGHRVALALSAQRLPLDDALVSALPEQLAGLLGELSPEGLAGVKLRKLVMDVGGDPNDGEVRQRRMEIDADMTLPEVTVAGKRIADVTARVVKEPNSPVVKVEDLSGRMLGGRIAGQASLLLREQRTYHLRCSVNDVKLDELLQPDAPGGQDDRRRIPGTVAGELSLQQEVGRPGTLEAQGVLRISDAEVYRLPVFLGLLQVVTLQLPGDDAFRQGAVRYHVRKGEIIFREIRLSGATGSGSALSMIGSGKMDLKTEKLDLRFLSRPLGKLPVIGPDLETLLKPIAKEIMEVRVDGTLAKPRTRTVPLTSLDQAIRRLLTPEGAQ